MLVLVDRAVEVAVDRLEEFRRGVVRVGRIGEERAERPGNGLEALFGVRAGARGVRGAFHAAPHFEDRRHERTQRRAGRDSKELDFVVGAELRQQQVRDLLRRTGRSELAQAVDEFREILPQEASPRQKVRVREEVDALHVVVVAKRRMDARNRGAEGRGHLVAGPGERLDAPLLAAVRVEIQGLVDAVGEDDAAHRQPERLKPLVHLGDVGRRDGALGDFDRVADDVGAHDLLRQRAGALLLGKGRKPPEFARKERQRGHGVVAARNRHHVAEDARLVVPAAAVQRGFRDEHDGVAVFEFVEHALFEDERVVEKIVAAEGARAPPGLDGDRAGPLRRGRHGVPEK